MIDVAGGSDIPCKRGPGVLHSDILIINKADLAPHVGVDLDFMIEEERAGRGGKPFIVTNCRSGEAVDDIVAHIARDVLFDD